MTKNSFSLLLALSALASFSLNVSAHQHLAAGASGTNLTFVNEADFGSTSGFVFNMEAAEPDSPYAGNYIVDEMTFTALAVALDLGGGDPNAAPLGTRIYAKLLGVEGPADGSFSFWETSASNATWSVPVSTTNGTNTFRVTESDGSPGSDPYGHIHGRVYSVNQPGLYKVTWQFIDLSTNGVNGGPVENPSAPFSLYFQADFTIGGIARSTNGVDITFAAPSNLPEDGIGQPTEYQLQVSPVLGDDATWDTAGGVVIGDDHLHTQSLPIEAGNHFFRLGPVVTGGAVVQPRP